MSYNPSWPSSGSSWHSGSWNEKKTGSEPGSFKFKSEPFFSTAPVSTSSNYCPYSLRQSQLSVPYEYDLLLVYDPESPDYVEKLMEYLTPQNLKIFDFARDAPPGMPQRKLLQSAFQFCRYTCIVITKKFTSNFWLQLRTDMSIQDMLDNEQKMYSVIVVVMDPDVKRRDLPLDLATLSPLFCTDRFFEDRIKRAFSKSAAFPPMLSLESAKVSHVPDPPEYNDLSMNQHPSEPDLAAVDTSFSGNLSHPNICRLSVGSRIPHEHGDGTFVMPPSIFPASIQDISCDPLVMHRAISVTINSTGSRLPQESSETSQNAAVFCNDSLTEAKDFYMHDSINGGTDSPGAVGVEEMTYQECKFSSPDQTDSGSLPGNSSNHQECGSPAFFSLSDSSAIETMASDMSALEISTASLPILSPAASLDPALSLSLQQSKNVEEVAESRRLDQGDNSCVSLPANIKHGDSCKKDDLRDTRKSRSVRSLISIKLSEVSKAFKSKKS